MDQEGVRLASLVASLWAQLQEQQEELTKLRTELAALEAAQAEPPPAVPGGTD